MRFRRSTDAALERFVRSDVSLISEVIGHLAAARTDGLPVGVDQLPIVVGASTLHADTVAAMPARSTAATVPARVRHLLERPDPDTDYRAFIHAGTLAMFHKGYAALLLDKPAPNTSSARVLDPTTVSWSKPTGWLVNTKHVPDDRIVSVALVNDPSTGPVGESPLTICRDALSMYGYAYRYLIDYFAQGGNPSSILRSQAVLGNAIGASGKTRAREIVDEWITARQERRPAVMDPTITLEVPPSTGELEAVRSILDYCSAEVARLLNMPGSLVNAPSNGYSLTYQNTGDEMRRWIALSLKPTWMARWESAFREMTGDPTIALDPTDLLDTYAALDTAGAPIPTGVPTDVR